eukprot:scaffold99177_cov24-Tisochrysis_lutea.AAC.1
MNNDLAAATRSRYAAISCKALDVRGGSEAWLRPVTLLSRSKWSNLCVRLKTPMTNVTKDGISAFRGMTTRMNVNERPSCVPSATGRHMRPRTRSGLCGTCGNKTRAANMPFKSHTPRHRRRTQPEYLDRSDCIHSPGCAAKPNDVNALPDTSAVNHISTARKVGQMSAKKVEVHEAFASEVDGQQDCEDEDQLEAACHVGPPFPRLFGGQDGHDDGGRAQHAHGRAD